MFSKKRKISKYKINYSTHYKSKRRTKKIKKIKKQNTSETIGKIKILFIFSLVLSLIYIVLFSDTFKLEKITFPEELNTNLELQDQINIFLEEEIGKKIFTISNLEIENKISEEFINLEIVKVEKNYPNLLEVRFNAYEQKANVINQSTNIKKSYIINSIGNVIKEDYENPELPYININTDEALNKNETIIKPDKLIYILESTNQFQDQFGMQITNIEYIKIARELHITTERDFTIWLDIQEPYQEQFKKLKKSLKKLDIYTLDIEYIDLRIAANNGDRIIYKLK